MKASNLLGLPVSSKTKLDNVTSSVLARKVSAILSASTLLAPLTTSLTNASSLSINGPSRVNLLLSELEQFLTIVILSVQLSLMYLL